MQDFLETSWSCVKELVARLQTHGQDRSRKPLSFFKFKTGQKANVTFDGNTFFIRGSIEYSNPQLTVEEVQGIIGARLLETCSNYFKDYGLQEPDARDLSQLCELLKKPSEGPAVAFLLNTDDIEADRYSLNPLRRSIVESGQSAFSVAYVKTDLLDLDEQFMKKYEGTLVSRDEAELISKYLKAHMGSYLDLIDSVKYEQLEKYSEAFGIDLSLPALRMPLETLKQEDKEGLLHCLISQIHKDYDTISQAYSCMGRSMAKRTTLLTVPHSKKGYGSKRAARGRLHFEGARLLTADVKYKNTLLYPNSVDPNDVSIAQAEDEFSVSGEKLANYDFQETPSSPQFFIYSLGSPENAVLLHGIGVYSAPKLLQSYMSFHEAVRKGDMIKCLAGRHTVTEKVPMQFNLSPGDMWVHPKHRNIDASLGTVGDLSDLVRLGMKIESFSPLE